jgi:hypothetical protein
MAAAATGNAALRLITAGTLFGGAGAGQNRDAACQAAI